MINVTLSHFLVLGAIIFSLGVIGLLLGRRNIITILMSLELMLLAININFVAFSSYNHTISGHVFALFVLTIAAAEAGIGLAILVLYFRHRKDITIDSNNSLKG